MFMKNGQDKAS